MPIYNIIDKQVDSPGRQIELDTARGLAVLFMIAVHLLRSFSNEIVKNSLGTIVSYNKQVSFAEVGGKARALIETTNAGMPVPEGIVLSVSFFKEWLYEIKVSKVWKVMLQDVTKDCCDQVKYLAQGKRFAEGQKRIFKEKIKALNGEVLVWPPNMSKKHPHTPPFFCKNFPQAPVGNFIRYLSEQAHFLY